MVKFSLVIPAKNEEKRILLPLLDYYVSLHRRFGAHNFEILITVNNTTDDTVQIVKRLTKALHCKEIKVYDLGTTKGKGESILQGIRKAKGKIVGFIDADGSSSGHELMKAYSWLGSHPQTDSVIASRYMEDSHIIGDRPLQRKIASKILHSLIKGLFRTKYHDFFCGLKLFKRKTINTILTETSAYGWGFDVSLIMTLLTHGYSVKEMPTSWIDREYSKVNILKYGMKVLRELFTVYLQERARVRIAPNPVTV